MGDNWTGFMRWLGGGIHYTVFLRVAMVVACGTRLLRTCGLNFIFRIRTKQMRLDKAKYVVTKHKFKQ